MPVSEQLTRAGCATNSSTWLWIRPAASICWYTSCRWGRVGSAWRASSDISTNTFWLSDAHVIVSSPAPHRYLTSKDRPAALLPASVLTSIYGAVRHITRCNSHQHQAEARRQPRVPPQSAGAKTGARSHQECASTGT